ncbi:MAG TPA: hypothetical protein VFN56_01020 [Candidatus Saccharimonadales bacterium]|nr:hypothetical protein [Candidatus Saccharimonadales bacterium]
MSEVLTSSEGNTLEAVQQVGRITVLEALAQETSAVSANMSHRSTRQGAADFEDD